MARKSTRQNRRASRSTSTRSSSSSRTRSSTEFEPDYGYVIKDLRRIGIYAGICIAILIVLTFIF